MGALAEAEPELLPRFGALAARDDGGQQQGERGERPAQNASLFTTYGIFLGSPS